MSGAQCQLSLGSALEIGGENRANQILLQKQVIAKQDAEAGQ